MPILVSSGEAPTPVEPTIPPPVWVALDIVWQGSDGSTWLLTNPGSQVTLMPGMRGLDAVQIDRWTSDAPGLAGNRYRGHRTPAREIFLPVQIRGRSSLDWLAIRRAWDRSLSPDDEGVLEVVVRGTRRTLPCRWVRTEPGWSRDPLLAGKSVSGEYLEASGSHWQGETIIRAWRAENPLDFFLAADGVFFISASNSVGSARIDNPGDVPAWPVWTITGPCDNAAIGMPGAQIVIPFALTAGQWLTIDTRPDRQTVVDHLGVDRVGDLGPVAFAPVPAGMSVVLSMDATGTATGFGVTAELTPLYRRAW